ncbi:hypothetical protein [Campylobacter concisus]
MIAYKCQKCQNKNKAKKGRNLKSQKTWAGFCKFSFSQSPSKNGHQTIFTKKIHGMRKKMQQNPAINLQKWITKTAKN